jgi:lysophospholipase L1-like esterase/pimeloyl-ACP methyl ester carboxylesterase
LIMKLQKNTSVSFTAALRILSPVLLSFALFAAITQNCFAEAFPGKVSQFHSFPRYDFEHGGRRCIVVTPRVAAEGTPWIWRARFFGHQPQADIALLNQGYHVAYTDVGNLFGAPEAVEIWNGFYEYLTKNHRFHARPALEGMSRGGLIIFNWAKVNPGKVSCIYGDAPVCDFKSWPGGKGTGKGGGGAWQSCLTAYGFTEAEALVAKVNPIDGLQALAAARVPILNVVGDADVVVPVAENTAILEKRYAGLKGPIEVIHKAGIGHHPHSLKDPKPIVDFVLGNRRDLTIVLAGDSTVTDAAGWGLAFAERFDQNVEVINVAKGGASSKSFRDAGYWNRCLIQEPDFVFIQFGHNDCPGKGPKRETDPETTYRQNLERFIADARAKGAKPVLVSPMTRRRFKNGKIDSILTPYAEAVHAVAAKTKTPMVDLHRSSVELFNELGDAGSADLCPEGDRTHFNQKGAKKMSDLIISGFPPELSELSSHLK